MFFGRGELYEGADVLAQLGALVGGQACAPRVRPRADPSDSARTDHPLGVTQQDAAHCPLTVRVRRSMRLF
jgi:hypothetical protein